MWMNEESQLKKKDEILRKKRKKLEVANTNALLKQMRMKLN